MNQTKYPLRSGVRRGGSVNDFPKNSVTVMGGKWGKN